jgi:FKBP-type peptidyl-prolyl cis-trans isomerase (trigger factor)
MADEKNYENLSVKKLEKSEVEIEASIPRIVMEKQWPKAVKKLSEDSNMPGFRPGKIPEKVLIDKLGDTHILEEAANQLFPEIVFDIFSHHVPNAIGRPMITITKIAKGEPLQFKIKTAILPEVKLPDYKAIAKKELGKKEDPIVIEEKEIDSVLTEMQKAIADQSKKVIADVPIDDEFAKKIGAFIDLNHLKEKIKENITQEKTNRALEKRRLSLIDAILEKTEAVLPELLIESEQERMLARFSEDIARMGMKPDDYFSHIKKTREDVKKEMRPQAEKNAKADMLLASIAKEEKIIADQTAVENEVKHILEHHNKDADPDQVRSYVNMILTHQKVFEFLESQK